MTTKENFKQKLEAQITAYQTLLAALDGLGLESLALEATLYGSQIDFDRLNHQEVIDVIKAIGGKWEKSVSEFEPDRVDYTTVKNGITIRCYKGEPPPNCRIEEVPEIIPAQPEKIVMRKKLVCKEPALDG